MGTWHLALKLRFEGVDKEQMNPMEAKKKNLVIAGVVAAALSLAVGTVAAQDYFSPLFSAYVDHVVPGDSPCGATPIRTITPSTYDETVMLWYSLRGQPRDRATVLPRGRQRAGSAAGLSREST